MVEGWIKIHRQLWDCWLWENPEYLRAWLDLLMLANHKPGKSERRGSVVEINRGQHLTSLEKLAKRWGWSIQNVRTFLRLLESDKKLTRKSTNRYTLITLVNYDIYQDNQHTDQQAANKQLTTNKNDKKIYTTIFDYWNAKGIIKHRALSTKIERAINGRLREQYSLEDLLQAIDNYHTVLTDPAYYWNHRWTLNDFLSRGLDRFVDEAHPLENYARGNGAQECKNANAPYPRSEMAESTLAACPCDLCQRELRDRARYSLDGSTKEQLVNPINGESRLNKAKVRHIEGG